MRKKLLPSEKWWESATEALLWEYAAIAKNGSPSPETDGEALGKISMRLVAYEAHFDREETTEKGKDLLRQIRDLAPFPYWYIARRAQWIDYILVHRDNVKDVIQYYLHQMEGEEETLRVQVLKARAEMALEYIKEAETYALETPSNNKKIAQARAIIFAERHGKGCIQRYLDYSRDYQTEKKRGAAQWKLS